MTSEPGPAHEELLARYREIVAKLGLDPHNAAILFHRTDDGARHYERKGVGWDAVVTERGVELERLHLANDEEALYQLARDKTFGMACDYELRHRADGQDSRRLLFAHQLDLMARVSPAWRDRLAAEFDAILAQHPYIDAAPSEITKPEPPLWPQIAVIVALLLFFVGIHYPLWSSWNATQRLADEGLVVSGTVTDKSTSYPKVGQTYHLDYAYEAGGARYSRSEVVEKYVHDRSDVGGRVSVTYVPDDPAIASISPGDEFARRAAWYVAIDLLLLLAFGGGIWRFLRRRGKSMENQEMAETKTAE